MDLIERPPNPKGLVRYPLDPLYLLKANILSPTESPKPGPTPGTPWTQDYVVYFNRGSWGSDHLPGWLHLNAPNGFGAPDKTVVSGWQLMLDGTAPKPEANPGQTAVECLEFEMTYVDQNLVAWKTTQSMRMLTDSGMKEIPGTRLERTSLVANDQWVTTIQGRTSVQTLTAGSKIYSDWDLLFRCQSLPFSTAANHKCTIIEELGVPRHHGEIYYSGSTESPDFGTLHTFVCQAEGVIPVDYWLNADHRLITAISGSFAEGYIPAEWVSTKLPDILTDEIARLQSRIS